MGRVTGIFFSRYQLMIFSDGEDDQLDALQFFINQLATSGLSEDISRPTVETYHNILRLAVEMRETSTVIFVYRHMLNSVGCHTNTYRIIEHLYGKDSANRIKLPLEFDRQRHIHTRIEIDPSEMLSHVPKIQEILTKNPTLRSLHQKKLLMDTIRQLHHLDTTTIVYVLKYLERRGDLDPLEKRRSFWPNAD